jgi:hypothetical protein
MSTGWWVNASNGQCISAPENDGDAMVTRPCDLNDTRQKITFYGDGQGIVTEARKDNNGIIDTWSGNVYWSGECGRGNDCTFHVQPITAQEPFPTGAFRWYGWGRQGGHDAAVQPNGTVTQNFPYDGQLQSIWLPYELTRECDTFGISLNQCSNATVVNAKTMCGQGDNATKSGCLKYCQNNPDKCSISLSNYCNDPANVTNDYCRNTYCPENPGGCDSGAAEFCAKNLGDNSFCACFSDNAFNNLPPVLKDDAGDLNMNPPVCWNTKCGAGNSYMTIAQRNALNGCPKCIQVQNFSNIGADHVNFKNISQNCGVNSTDKTVESPPGFVKKISSVSTTAKLLFGVMALLCVLACLCALLFL